MDSTCAQKLLVSSRAINTDSTCTQKLFVSLCNKKLGHRCRTAKLAPLQCGKSWNKRPIDVGSLSKANVVCTYQIPKWCACDTILAKERCWRRWHVSQCRPFLWKHYFNLTIII